MPIGINGSGTITGISAGGLPDGTIVQADLASGVAGNGPAFSAYQSSAQAVTGGVWTKIAFQTEEFDTANCFDSTTNYRFTPNVAGYYQINGAFYSTAAQTDGYLVGVAISKNGSQIKLSAMRVSGPYAGTQAVISSLVYMNGTTDYIELYGYADAGSAGTTSQIYQYFNGSLVRAA